MFERTYAAIQKAIGKDSTTVTPELVFEEQTETLIPTRLEYDIIKELSKGRLTPNDLSGQLDKYSSFIVRVLQELMKKRWVTWQRQPKHT